MADNQPHLPPATSPPPREPAGRRPCHAARRFALGALATLVWLASVATMATAPGTASAGGNGNALDEAEHHGSGVFRLRVHNYEPALRAIVGQPSVRSISFSSMLAGRQGVMARCGARCRTWTSGLQTSERWYPQGLAGSRESRWQAAPAAEVVVAAWYLRRSASDHTSVGSALKFISTSDWKYRNVPLRVPVQTGSGWTTERLAIHAGGVAWAGPYVYVAATDRLYRFDMRQIFTSGGGPFLLPDRRYLVVRKQPYENNPRLSSVSTDWSGSPALVSAEYSATNKTTDVVRWPLKSTGALRVTNGGVSSRYNFWVDKDSSIDKVQGVEAHRGTYWFSTSDGELQRARVGTQTGRETFANWGTSGSDSDVPQDLYAVPGQRMYGQTEERTDRRIFWRRMSAVRG